MKNFLVLLIILLIVAIGALLYRNTQLKDSLHKQKEENRILSQYTDEIKSSLDSLKAEISKSEYHKEIEKSKIKNYLKYLLPKGNMRFVPDIVPVKGDYIVSQKFSEKHPAYDFASEMGTEVIASAAGRVCKIYTDKYFGKTIEVDHLNGYKTKYAHLVKILVKENYFVEKGKVIGLVGTSGRSTAPHLHFEIIKNNQNIDPSTVIKGMSDVVIQK